jgi:hypothetical protein
MLKQDEHEGLCGLSRWSVIPYIHGRESCITMCVALFNVELNFFAPAVCPAFL